MNLQKCPNWWSCLPTAFAIALDVPVRRIIEEIGHDGSELLFPQAEEPYSRRAFHIQELIDPCFKRGYALLLLEAVPIIASPRDAEHYEPVIFKEGNNVRMMRFMQQFNGVVAGETGEGRPHCVAWESKTEMFYDPNNEEPTGMSDTAFSIREFFALVRL